MPSSTTAAPSGRSTFPIAEARCRASPRISWSRCPPSSAEPAPSPLSQPALPATVRGLIDALGAYQALTAEAAWSGTRRDGVVALASHPLVGSLSLAEALYDEMAAAHRAYLPDRLLH